MRPAIANFAFPIGHGYVLTAKQTGASFAVGYVELEVECLQKLVIALTHNTTYYAPGYASKPFVARMDGTAYHLPNVALLPWYTGPARRPPAHRLLGQRGSRPRARAEENLPQSPPQDAIRHDRSGHQHAGRGWPERLVLLSAGGMCQSKVKVTAAAEVDQELLAWIRRATLLQSKLQDRLSGSRLRSD